MKNITLSHVNGWKTHLGIINNWFAYITTYLIVFMGNFWISARFTSWIRRISTFFQKLLQIEANFNNLSRCLQQFIEVMDSTAAIHSFSWVKFKLKHKYFNWAFNKYVLKHHKYHENSLKPCYCWKKSSMRKWCSRNQYSISIER